MSVEKTGATSQLREKERRPGPAADFQKPRAVERLFGRALVFLVRIGFVRGHFYVLEVRGRKSGKTISLLVDPLDIDGNRYLVSPRGQSNWVHNARNVGEVVLAHALRRQRYKVCELPLASARRS